MPMKPDAREVRAPNRKDATLKNANTMFCRHPKRGRQAMLGGKRRVQIAIDNLVFSKENEFELIYTDSYVTVFLQFGDVTKQSIWMLKKKMKCAIQMAFV